LETVLTVAKHGRYLHSHLAKTAIIHCGNIPAYCSRQLLKYNVSQSVITLYSVNAGGTTYCLLYFTYFVVLLAVFIDDTRLFKQHYIHEK